MYLPSVMLDAFFILGEKTKKTNLFFMLISSCMHFLSFSSVFPRTTDHFLPEIHRHLWELTHGDSFSVGEFTGHRDGCSASCCWLGGCRGGLERIFSKFLCEERVTQHYADPLPFPNSTLGREALTVQAHTYRPPHYHPHKCLNKLNVRMSNFISAILK